MQLAEFFYFPKSDEFSFYLIHPLSTHSAIPHASYWHKRKEKIRLGCLLRPGILPLWRRHLFVCPFSYFFANHRFPLVNNRVMCSRTFPPNIGIRSIDWRIKGETVRCDISSFFFAVCKSGNWQGVTNQIPMHQCIWGWGRDNAAIYSFDSALCWVVPPTVKRKPTSQYQSMLPTKAAEVSCFPF